MKKNLINILTIALILSLFAFSACSDSDDNNPTDGNNNRQAVKIDKRITQLSYYVHSEVLTSNHS